MATFVLVHGAWAGGWAWTRVADLLIARGHRVHVPTLSGLGERSHLADRDIDLTAHVNDVVNEIKWKDLENVVLASAKRFSCWQPDGRGFRARPSPCDRSRTGEFMRSAVVMTSRSNARRSSRTSSKRRSEELQLSGRGPI